MARPLLKSQASRVWGKCGRIDFTRIYFDVLCNVGVRNTFAGVSKVCYFDVLLCLRTELI